MNWLRSFCSSLVVTADDKSIFSISACMLFWQVAEDNRGSFFAISTAIIISSGLIVISRTNEQRGKRDFINLMAHPRPPTFFAFLYSNGNKLLSTRESLRMSNILKLIVSLDVDGFPLFNGSAISAERPGEMLSFRMLTHSSPEMSATLSPPKVFWILSAAFNLYYSSPPRFFAISITNGESTILFVFSLVRFPTFAI